MSAPVHSFVVPTRWADFDQFGHIMNAKYIEIAQEARVAFARDYFLGQGIEFPVFVRRLEADYLRGVPSTTSELRVETSVVEIGTTSFTTRQEILDEANRVCCVIMCVQVAIDMQSRRPRAITKKEVGILTRAADSIDE